MDSWQTGNARGSSRAELAAGCLFFRCRCAQRGEVPHLEHELPLARLHLPSNGMPAYMARVSCFVFRVLTARARFRVCRAGTLYSLLFAAFSSYSAEAVRDTAVAATTNRYEFHQHHDPDGIGKFYMGRE